MLTTFAVIYGVMTLGVATALFSEITVSKISDLFKIGLVSLTWPIVLVIAAIDGLVKNIQARRNAVHLRRVSVMLKFCHTAHKLGLISQNVYWQIMMDPKNL